MSRTVLAKIVTDDAGDAAVLSADDRALIAKVLAEGAPEPGEDPELDELVRKTVAEMHASRGTAGTGAAPVEIRKTAETAAAAAAAREGRIAKLEQRVDAMTELIGKSRAEARADQALDLIAKGGRENLERAAGLLSDPVTYEAHMERGAELARRESARPVVKAVGGRVVAELVEKAERLREADPKLSMAEAMDRAEGEIPGFAERYAREVEGTAA